MDSMDYMEYWYHSMDFGNDIPVDSDDFDKPEGFCDEAWKAIYQYAFALSHGAGKEVFYYGDWIRKPGVAICSCNDGLRPVIFKLEATDEESEIDYTPVR